MLMTVWYGMVWYGNCLFEKIKSTLKHNSKYIIRVRVRVKMIYFDKEHHDIEETNTETFMCRSMSATNAYTELQMIRK